MRRWHSRLLSVCVGFLVVVVLYRRIDVHLVLENIRQLNSWWLAASLIMFLPLISLTALRLRWLSPGRAPSIFECHRLVLGAGVLNLVLPSKLGDLAKAYWMHKRSGLDLSSATSLVVYERCADLFAICSFATIGAVASAFPSSTQALVLITAVVAAFLGAALVTPFPVLWFTGIAKRLLPQRLKSKAQRLSDSWVRLHTHVRSTPRRFVAIFAGTQFLWLLHLSQVWIFTFALGARVSFGANLTINALGILVGLLPLTFAGIGTRDAALIALYAGTLPAESAAVVGLFGTARYLVPALLGLPFLATMLRWPSTKG